MYDIQKATNQLLDVNFHENQRSIQMATHSSVLAWRIWGMGEPGELPSMGLHRVRHDWSDLAALAAAFKQQKVVSEMSVSLSKSQSQ